MKVLITYITFGVLTLTVLSCDSFLDPGSPKDQIPSELAFFDNKTATASVTGIYSRMNQMNYQFANVLSMILPAMAADEFVYAVASPPYDEFKNNQVLSSNSNVNTLWSQAYSYIAQANLSIQALESESNLDEDVKNQLIGEARFIRAFNYFYLTNYFGEVPLVTGTDVMQNNSLPRSTQEDVYALIIEDLKEAKERLYDGYPSAEHVNTNGERIRPNKGAATALLARVYLYTKNWEAAEKEATQVINNDLYKILEPSELNTVFKANSKEAIWQLQAVNTAGGRNTWEGFLMIPATPTSSPLFRLIPEYLYDAFEEGDLRFDQWVGSMTTSAGIEHRYPFKYQVRFGVTPIEEYTMVLRLAEQYLIRAEACLEQNKLSEAMKDINTIRVRAGLDKLIVGSNYTSVKIALEQERRVELFAEWGHRWLDLKRWPSESGELSKTRADDILKNLKPNWNSKSIYWPLPDDAIRSNPNLTPNKQ